MLNVNVPDLPMSEIAGVVVTRQGQERYVDLFEMGKDKDGLEWCANMGGERLPSPGGEQSFDDTAVNENRISITPLHFDLTNAPAIGVLTARLERLRLTAEATTPAIETPSQNEQANRKKNPA
jgi:5'-nucleotidase